MFLLITVTLRSRSQQESSVVFLCDFKTVQRADRTDSQRLDAMLQVIDGARRRREVKDVVDLSGIEWQANIVLEELKLPVVRQVREVLHVASQQVVGTNYRVSLRQHRVAQVRAEESRAAGYQYSH
jgi:hypothetical protein